jgi:hypothetical protein
MLRVLQATLSCGFFSQLVSQSLGMGTLSKGQTRIKRGTVKYECHSAVHAKLWLVGMGSGNLGHGRCKHTLEVRPICSSPPYLTSAFRLHIGWLAQVHEMC